MILFRKILFLIFAAFIINGCGEELSLNDFPINDPPGVVGDTVYIPVTPSFFGFNEPTDIFVGFEPVLYICDKGNNRIVQMDRAGGVISYSEFILKPRKIAQDRNYDLLVIGSKVDTILPNILDTVDVVYRIKVGQLGVLTGITPTIAFKSNQATPIPGDHGGFNGIATFYNNYYLVSRSGINNINPIDPDNAIFKIDKFDNTFPVPERLSGFNVDGQGLMSLQKISGIVTFPFNYTDLIYIQNYSDAVFKIQWCIYDDLEGIYNPKFTPENNVDLLRTNYLVNPMDITIDHLSNIYIVDSDKDSLYKFNSLGKRKSESFGGRGNGLSQFNSPMGVAFFDKTLYICDTGNNRVLRFLLSTDRN